MFVVTDHKFAGQNIYFFRRKNVGKFKENYPEWKPAFSYIVCEECPRPKTRQKDDEDLTNSYVYFS